ncbi:MAG: hypothetical protein OXI66_07620 [Boseongicola sp.]|nr:hypothetical protein [Boseongicola sp.]MDE0345634.1 hypothetical protein [Boseongicola sp.]
MWITRIGMWAGLAMLAGFGPATAPEIHFLNLTQTGIDSAFWQTYKHVMGDKCGTFNSDRQFLFEIPSGNSGRMASW